MVRSVQLLDELDLGLSLKRKDNMRSTSDIKLAVQNVLAKYGYIMPKDLYLAIEDLHDEIESDREGASAKLDKPQAMG